MSSKVFEMQGYLKLSVSEYDRAMGPTGVRTVCSN